MVSVSPREKQRALPLFPVFLPVLFTFGCLCLPRGTLVSASDGTFMLAAGPMFFGGSISGLMTTLGLALTRSESQSAKYVRWLAYALALAGSAWVVVRHDSMIANALATVMDAENRRAIVTAGKAEKPWVYLGAILSLIPTMLGGAVGVRWIETVKARLRRDDAANAKGSAHVFE